MLMMCLLCGLGVKVLFGKFWVGVVFFFFFFFFFFFCLLSLFAGVSFIVANAMF